MLKVQESFSIAVHALVRLAQKPGVHHAGNDIAEACQFSTHHLSKVLAQLVRAGLLESKRGPSGGVRFTRKPEAVTLSMIQDAIEGQPVPRKGCLLPPGACPGNRCALGCFLSKMETEVRRVFTTTTLADILRGAQPKRKK